MKKFFLTFFLLFFGLPCFAQYFPQYIESAATHGEGLMSTFDDFVIYSSNSEKSAPVAVVKFYQNKPKMLLNSNYKPPITDYLIAFSQIDNLALFSVLQNDDEWFKILYSQKNGFEGWVKKTEKTDFYTWYEFVNLYGRKNGLYLLRDVPKKYKKLYSAPSTKSTVVDEFDFPKHISVWLLSHSWALVKVTTYEGIVKTGWLQWRTDSGTLLAFPDFSN